MQLAPILFGLLVLATDAPAQVDVTSRQTVFAGPYLAEVINVIDGDTLDVRVPIGPCLVSEYAVRLRGIDAPQLRGAGCIEERDWAERSKADVERFYGPGTEVHLRDVQYDVVSGHVVAEVRRCRSGRWLVLADEMIRRRMAVAWEPGRQTFRGACWRSRTQRGRVMLAPIRTSKAGLQACAFIEADP